jgi:hypothetical protein
VNRKLRLSLIGPALMLALAAGNVVAGSGAQVSFSPQSVNASVGATVAVDVTVANVNPDPGLAAYDLTLQFDPGVVRLDDLSDSGFITSGENVVICVPGQIDNAGGSANATCTAIPLFGAPGVSTTEAVPLLHASFTTLAVGTSALTLSGSLSGPKGTAIAASFGGGTIRVTASQPASSPTTVVAASATPSTVASPAVTATASSTPRAVATPIASPRTRAAPAAPTKTPQASAPSNGGGHGTSVRTLIALLTAGAVAIGVTGSILIGRRLRRRNGS